ncbi:MAG: YggS family pyridoxal phosphate-dependent enzyme, partial [Pseudomonadota bacterium]
RPPVIMAVSKTFATQDIMPVLEAGHRCFGENKIQEAQGKWPALLQEFPDCALHLIGPLQTNKAKVALGLFDVIHTLDREKLARKLCDLQEAHAITCRYFIQVNTGEESQKAGISPKDCPEFTRYVREDLGLDVMGLMAIPPQEDLPALHFALLAKLAKELGLSSLSMGMSADYEQAIPHGATIIRIGSKIFGPRSGNIIAHD